MFYLFTFVQHISLQTICSICIYTRNIIRKVRDLILKHMDHCATDIVNTFIINFVLKILANKIINKYIINW